MNELKPATRRYIWLLLALAVSLTAWAANRAAPNASDAVFAVAAFVGMAVAWRFPIVFAAKSKLYVDSAVTIAAVLLLPPALAAAAIGAGTIGGYLLRRSAIDWPEATFNSAQVMLTALVSALLLEVSGWRPFAAATHMLGPLLIIAVIAVTTFTLNILLISVVTALESDAKIQETFWAMLHEDFRFETLAYATLIATGTLIALVASTFPWAVVLLVILLVVTHYTLSQQTRLRLEAEHARIMSDASLAEAQRLAHVGSWRWYPKTNRWVWSDEVYRIFGIAPRETFPTLDDILRVVHPEDRESIAHALREARERRTAFAIEHQIQHEGGRARYVEHRGAVMPTANGSLTIYGTVQDISERVRAEQAMREAARAAQEADRAKSRLLTMASHDLRTPLTAIQGYLEMVTSGAAGEICDEQRELLAIAQRNAVDLGVLINDLLDLARIEAGALKLRVAHVDVKLTIEHIINTLTPLATEKGIWLKATLSEPSLSVVADPARLNQILLNLIGNAVKFTDRGGVDIRAWSDNGLIAIEVSDTGCGIASEALAHIFEEFNQGGEEARRKGGAGLGLAIVKQLISLHEGTIDVDSALNVGTTFLVRLPAVR